MSYFDDDFFAPPEAHSSAYVTQGGAKKARQRAITKLLNKFQTASGIYKRLLICTIAALFGLSAPLFGQYYDWGQSPDSIRWNQIRGPFGRIIYPDYFESGAAKVSTYFNAVTPTLGYGFKYDRIQAPVILHTLNFQANGIVMWAPKRMELRVIPEMAPYTEPWLKQLTVHEGRHTVQYGNLYRGWFMKTLGVVFGQHAGLFSTALLPFWLLEGDATQAETQAFEFGRALQPSFTIEYRAYFTEGPPNFALDKWFCGSYKDFIPNHYQFGYQLTAWGRERYGDDIWGRVAEYGSRNPYSIISINPALRKYYRTSVREIARGTMADLAAFWKSLPEEEDSGTLIPTPVRSYTVYDTPMPLNDSTVIVLKQDMARANRFVSVDPRSGAEKHLCYTGFVSTPPTLRDSMIYWTEYRNSTFWEQSVFSRLCTYDLRTKRRNTLNDRRNALYATPLPGGELATIGYDYRGQYLLELGHRRRFPIPDSMSVHGLAYDDRTGTLAFIGLSDGGMAFYGIDPATGTIAALTPPGRTTVYNLRAGDGKLAYNSIASGKDEIHLYDLTARQEYRLTASRYGSVSPSAPQPAGKFYFTTYTRKGYLLAEEDASPATLRKTEYRRIPENRINPPRRQWEIMQMGAVKSPEKPDSTAMVKRFRKGSHLVNLHSWTPWSFNPFNVVEEDKIDIKLGATVMSQNLLSNTFGYLSYGYAGGGGHQVKGLIQYYGLAPKFQIGATFGGSRQRVYGNVPENTPIPALKQSFELQAQVSLPMTLGSGYHRRALTPTVSLLHLNSLLYAPEAGKFNTGYQRIIASLIFIDNVRLAERDILPKWGYALKLASVGAPFNADFGSLVSFYARGFLPGVAAHHSLTLRGNVHYQKKDEYNFAYKELAPRGTYYNYYTATRYVAAAADYQLPVCYPDWGISGLIYLKRIRVNAYYDFARMEHLVWRNGRTVGTMKNLNSYGGEIMFDTHPLRIPVNVTTVRFYLYKPSDRRGVITGLSLSLPI